MYLIFTTISFKAQTSSNTPAMNSNTLAMSSNEQTSSTTQISSIEPINVCTLDDQKFDDNNRGVRQLQKECFKKFGYPCELYRAGEEEPLLSDDYIRDSVTTLYALPVQIRQCLIISLESYDNHLYTQYRFLNNNYATDFVITQDTNSMNHVSISRGWCNYDERSSVENTEDRMIVPLIVRGDFWVVEKFRGFTAILDDEDLINSSFSGGYVNLNLETLRSYISETSYEELVSFIDKINVS